jgi:hypothetical protein
MMIGTGRGKSMRYAYAAPAAVALAAALAACGGGGAATGATTTSARTASATPASATPASATTAAQVAATQTTGTSTSAKSRAGDIRPPAAFTPPGTKLSVGQTAQVAYHPAEVTGGAKSSKLKVTVQSFEKGSLSDFNGIQLDAAQKAGTPYYVKVHVVNLGPAAVDVDGTAAAIEGVDSTGSNQSSVTFIGSFPRCPDAASTTPIPAGKGYNDCMTFLIPGGIKAISYNGTDAYIDSPVTWAPH